MHVTYANKTHASFPNENYDSGAAVEVAQKDLDNSVFLWTVNSLPEDR